MANLKVEDSTHSTITVSWTKPEDCGNNVITAYRVTLKEDPSSARDEVEDGENQAQISVSDVQEVLVDDAEVTSATFSELPAERAYTVEVSVVCGDKESERTTLKVTTSKMLNVCFLFVYLSEKHGVSPWI